MNRDRIDLVVTLTAAALIVTGGFFAWQAYRQWTAWDDMGGHMGTVGPMHGLHAGWYLLATIFLVAVLLLGYLAIRPGAEVGESDEDPQVVDATDRSLDPSASGSELTTERLRELLTALPADERRVLEPVLDSPGLTQVELRDRADFSKSKVSQVVNSLEQRGLLYRQPQGRTYRVYPGEDDDPTE